MGKNTLLLFTIKQSWRELDHEKTTFSLLMINFRKDSYYLQNPVIHILRGNLEEEALIEDWVVVTKIHSYLYEESLLAVQKC